VEDNVEELHNPGEMDNVEELHIVEELHNLEGFHNLAVGCNGVGLHNQVVGYNWEGLHNQVEEYSEVELHNQVEDCNLEALLIFVDYSLVVVDMHLVHMAYEVEKEFGYYIYYFLEDMLIEYLEAVVLEVMDFEEEPLNCI
jgi:hypothetical protein